jgi:hypothetical protein
MFTGYLSAELAGRGFGLLEIPVEIPKDDDIGDSGKDEFVISLALLNELREQYHLEALLIGNVCFVKHPHYPDGREVASIYAKLIDVETLKVLCQLTLPFDTWGVEMDEVAEVLAGELAVLAGLEAPAPADQ